MHPQPHELSNGCCSGVHWSVTVLHAAGSRLVKWIRGSGSGLHCVVPLSMQPQPQAL